MRRLAVAALGTVVLVAVAAFVADLVREYRQDRDEAKARALPDHQQSVHLSRTGMSARCGSGTARSQPMTSNLRAVTCPVCLDLAISDPPHPMDRRL